MDVKNIFGDIPKNLDDEIIEQLTRNQHVRIERIISKGHTSPSSGWYDQQENEWVMVLQGGAKIVFEGRPAITLKSGDYLEIQAHEKHKIIWTEPDIETIWLAVFY